MTLLILLLLGQAALAGEALRRTPLMAAPMLVMAYLIAAEGFYALAALGAVPREVIAPPLWPGLYHVQSAFYFVLAAVFAAAYVATLGSKARVAAPAAPTNSFLAELAALAVGLIWSAVNLYSEDPATLWRNDTYLAMTAPDRLLHRGALAAFFLQTLQPAAVLTAVALGLALRRGARWMALGLAVPFLYLALFEIGAHSRAGAVVLGALAFVLLLNRRATLRGAAVAVGLTATLAWSAALVGRSGGEHGFATLPQSLAAAASPRGAQDLLAGLANLFEGPLVLATSSNLSLDYAPAYKELSFSPLPSLLDHFDQIRDLHQIRIGVDVPVSGYTEAYAFGLGYFLLLIATLATSLGLAAQLARRRPGLLAALVNLLVLLSTVLLFAYNVRNGFRLLVYCDLASLALLAIGARLSRGASGRAGLDARRRPGAWPPPLGLGWRRGPADKPLASAPIQPAARPRA